MSRDYFKKIMIKKVKEKLFFRGTRITQAQIDCVQEFANIHNNGNFSDALRDIIEMFKNKNAK